MSDSLAPHSPASRRQPALGAEPQAAVSLAWRHRGDAAALWRALARLHEPGAVIGIGAPLAEAVGLEVAGLQPFERLQRGRFTMPATQLDLWALVPAHDPGQAFERAEALAAELAPWAELVEVTPLFGYRQGRDLTGYKDGTENPTGDEAWAAALVPEGDWAGASFVLVQRWLHFRERFAALPQPARDHLIGRRLSDDAEIAEAPESAHVKRTAQEDFEPPAFMLRRSMPWGDLRRHGLQFIAYASSLAPLAAQLRRMMGLDDGLPDALLGHSQAETGAWYWCPPWTGRGLQLPPVSAAMTEPAPPAPQPAEARLRVCTDGPYELEGALDIEGTACAQARLCRCGQSLRMPWCDNSHLDSGFTDDGDVPPIDEPQAAPVPCVLRVQAMPGGPLVLHGTVQLVGDEGRTITRCSGPTLCRCGRSQNRPFCDGSHAA